MPQRKSSRCSTFARTTRSLRSDSGPVSPFNCCCIAFPPDQSPASITRKRWLLCKVAGAVTRKGYLYIVFLKVPVPRLLPSQLVEPVAPQPRGQCLYGNFLGHVHITALSRYSTEELRLVHDSRLRKARSG